MEEIVIFVAAMLVTIRIENGSRGWKSLIDSIERLSQTIYNMDSLLFQRMRLLLLLLLMTILIVLIITTTSSVIVRGGGGDID